MAFGHKNPVDTANYTLRDKCSMCMIQQWNIVHKYINYRQMPRKIKNQTACIALHDFSYNVNIESKNLISTRLTCLAHIQQGTAKEK
jgi:hypothetical protein